MSKGSVDLRSGAVMRGDLGGADTRGGTGFHGGAVGAAAGLRPPSLTPWIEGPRMYDERYNARLYD